MELLLLLSRRLNPERTLVVLFLLLVAVVTAIPAQAQVSVDRAIIYFHAGDRPIENIVVRNSGEETLSITANPDLMVNPGSPTERREASEELLVSPKRFALEPGGQRTVRLLLKKPYSDLEQVYRVTFVPESRGFGKEEESIAAGKKTMLKVLTGMGILILVEPKVPESKLEWSRKQGKFAISNTGNINIFLSDGKACQNEGENCQSLPVSRLYPGNTIEASVPDDRTIRYRKEVRQQFEEVVIPPSK